jgi:hypothetical protein
MYKKIKIACSFVLLLLLAGCNSGGMNLGGDSSSDEPIVLSSLSDTSSSDFGLGSGNETSGSGGDGVVVAQIHNPEPATMLLWGAGLLGAAISRKRRNKKSL